MKCFIFCRWQNDIYCRLASPWQELGISYTSVAAVDGQQLNEVELQNLQIQYLPGYKDPWSGRNMTHGEIGCFLSHYNVWKDVVENGYEKVSASRLGIILMVLYC